ncbi:hypothetical protein A2197_01865 [Candidatus Woesebacteria bacterium RIFOXYA1_FULL_48_16]|uniref:Uncharacterized protein n=1 Tax=Candidatus Woesebacteria bacterium RIFOXYA1_FULL_48_16 TaxID=1802535 RepID=A0A1F8CMM2_9BACT|nr:MAG: hypothetical protein A2197_01865 [Candidatus Woesebacteria bacterium RIFOXYA1_FULL_48_16]
MNRLPVSIALDRQKLVLYVLIQAIRQLASPILTSAKLMQIVLLVVEGKLVALDKHVEWEVVYRMKRRQESVLRLRDQQEYVVVLANQDQYLVKAAERVWNISYTNVPT